MNISEIYKTPKSEILEYTEKSPALIKVVYALTLGVVLLGIADMFLVYEPGSEDIEFEVEMFAFFAFINIGIGWLICNPVAKKSDKSSRIPLFLIILDILVIAFNVYDGTFVGDLDDAILILELGLLVAIFFILKSKKGMLWCNQKL